METKPNLRRRFLKPHPNFMRKKGLKGVWWEESIYYYWFAYLQRSDKYAEACKRNGKGMEQLYADFGDVRAVSFKKWWKKKMADGTERGMYLFAESPLTLPKSFSTIEDLDAHRDAIKSGDAIAILLPSHQTRTDLVRLTKKILQDHKTHEESDKTFNTSTARYKLAKFTKNSIQSLKEGLRALDLDDEGLNKREIGEQIFKERGEKTRYNESTREYDKVVHSEQTQHIHAARLINRAIKNIDAVKNAVASEGERGWGEFPVKLEA